MNQYIISAKFSSFCFETKIRIKKGETVLYDKRLKRVFSENSNEFKKFKESQSQENQGFNIDNWIESEKEIFCHSNNF